MQWNVIPYGIDVIRDIVDIICDTVEYIRWSDSRLLTFTEVVKQLNLPVRKLVDDCRTRWNSTYEMIAIALKLKDAFQLVLDPRCKLRAPKFVLSRIYLPKKATQEIDKVRPTLSLLYSEYEDIHNNEGDSSHDSQSYQGVNTTGISDWSEYAEYVNINKSIRPQKSKLEEYLEEHVYKVNEGSDFDALDCTVASKATFSVETRVIVDYCASLSTEIVQALLCGGH
ncbi:hypothetical protein CDL12_03446 [Handroanthus impetiginosus]|uniref:Uncharacterized protein n=1 Tax=Handroanthus impetiginosus TaxID=429701 RepID=A0A2G9I242_9LAMI|nr:hypothetical protein CDL12_03446 [Handroanthus impetiginosus]